MLTFIFTELGAGNEPASWIYFLPLPPLALMTLSGLYMLFQPYAARRSGGRGVGIAGLEA